MRHQKAGRKFGRNTSHRRAMFRNLAGNLVLHERIITTDEKAKELRRVVERLLSKAVRLGDDLTADLGKITDDAERGRILASRTHAQREVAKFLPLRADKTNSDGSSESTDLVWKLFHELGPRFVERNKANDNKGGGYTRIIKIGRRRGDNASLSYIEFIGSEHVGAPVAVDDSEEAATA
ncbi:MAG: 50S ribosomal protein L17 [Myxococcales bacterium]|nr:50S ribosomal protein L17 [Myxococcales bacterium]